jgi:hypothetical protein
MLHTYLGHTKNDRWEKKNRNSLLYFKFDRFDVYNKL